MSAGGPLAGFRILEVCHVLAGPYCAMLLADLGADVIKIEAPGEGDLSRGVGPHRVAGHGTYFASLNRGKRSVCLDLASPAGQTALGRLVGVSNALVTNLQPRAIRKLGLTYDQLSRHNPSIVCVALTGFGLDGPYSDRPAFDYVIQALSGLMQLTGDPGGPPVKAGYSAVDNSAGIMAAVGLLAKLLEGKGGQVDVSLYDSMLSQLNYIGSAYLNAGEKPARVANGGHSYFVPAQIFATLDGFLALFIAQDRAWRRFAEALGRPHWLSDARFATVEGRSVNRETVVGEVAPALAKEPTGHWVALLEPCGIAVAPVETFDQALDSDLARSRDMVIDVGTAERPLRLIGNPIKTGRMAAPPAPPPLLGEHSSRVLAEVGL